MQTNILVPELQFIIEDICKKDEDCSFKTISPGESDLVQKLASYAGDFASKNKRVVNQSGDTKTLVLMVPTYQDMNEEIMGAEGIYMAVIRIVKDDEQTAVKTELLGFSDNEKISFNTKLKSLVESNEIALQDAFIHDSESVQHGDMLLDMLNILKNKGNMDYGLQTKDDFMSQVASDFYGEKSLAYNFNKSARLYLTYVIFMSLFQGARYIETYMLMSKNIQSLESSSIALAVMRVGILLTSRIFEGLKLEVSQAYGSKNYARIGSIRAAGDLLAGFISLFVGTVLLTSRYWLKALGQDSKLADLAGDFLQIYTIAIPLMAFTISNNNVLFAINEGGFVGAVELLAVAAGIGITYVFVYDKLHIGFKGIDALAWSMVAQKAAIFIMTKAYLAFTKNKRTFDITSYNPREITKEFKGILRTGVPLCIQLSAEQFYTFIMIMFAGAISKQDNNNALSQANILAEYYTALSNTLTIATHFSSMQRVAEVFGRHKLLVERSHSSISSLQDEVFNESIENNIRNISKIILSQMVLGGAASLALGCIYLTLYSDLVNIYLSGGNFSHHDKEAIHQGLQTLFMFMAGSTLFDVLRNVMGGSLNGMDDVDSPMVTTLAFTILAGSLLSYLLSFEASMGLDGVMTSTMVSYMLGGLVLAKISHDTYKSAAAGNVLPNTLLQKVGVFRRSLQGHSYQEIEDNEDYKQEGLVAQ